jgi:hypothetical protein
MFKKYIRFYSATVSISVKFLIRTVIHNSQIFFAKNIEMNFF